GGAFPAARAWIRLGFPRLGTPKQYPPSEQCTARRLSALSSAALPTRDRPVASACSRCSMPGPFPAEIRATPLLSPFPPFLLPPTSLFMFFFPATLSGGNSTARAQASLSPVMRARSMAGPPTLPPQLRRLRVRVDRPRFSSTSSVSTYSPRLPPAPRDPDPAAPALLAPGLPLHLLVLTLLRYPPPRAHSAGASPWPDRTASAAPRTAPSPPPRQSRRARRSSPSPPPSSGGLPLNKSDLNHR
ncbi:hypothetical protein PVAP13_1NG285157, partial [Panicum virgatum]